MKRGVSRERERERETEGNVERGFFFIFKLKFCFLNTRASMHTYAV